jgi:phosphate transport system substrate-binding protein
MVIAGSDSMARFTQAIAQRLANRWQIVAPELRLGGTHAGFASFCAGIGAEFPDIVAATRRMRQAELDRCIDHGIADIIEVPVGFSAVVFVTRRDATRINLTPKLLYQALAAEVPQGHDLVANPFRRWSDIDRKLPAVEIRMLVPGTTTGTRNFFDDVFMQGGCRKFSVIKLTFNAAERVKLCTTPRRDGPLVELPSDDDEISALAQPDSPPGTIGIVPYFIATAHQDALQILPVNNIMPGPETIADDSYEGVHTLFFYVKRAHMRNHQGVGVVGGLRQFIIEATSEAARGNGGYLEALGLFPLPAAERAEQRRSALRLERFTR